MNFIIFIYCACATLIAIYGINCHVMIYLFRRQQKNKREEDQQLLKAFYSKEGLDNLPAVTTQIPIYNELNVAERVIDAVAAFKYPHGKHELQVLDDSTDETREIVSRKVKALRAEGVQIEHITRPTRKGFKAGALRYGMEKAMGEFLAIFDADFVPPEDFLLKSIPYFLIDPTIGFVQGRWAHINSEESVITKLQAIGIDGHFMIEQSARNYNGLCMNFNGTAGVFRKEAILDAGNWQDDTLTEDMDLSYRIQLAGWTSRYLLDLEAPAEIPANVNDFKSQQFRWAKGSIQTAIKLLPRIWASDFTFFKKLQATFHMTHYLVHPLMLYLSIMALPLLAYTKLKLHPLVITLLALIIAVSCIGPTRLYMTAEKAIAGKQAKKLTLFPFLVCFGCGLSINNSRAVFEAILGKKSDFIRTPKHGNRLKKNYRTAFNTLCVMEIMLGIWCLLGLLMYFKAGQYLIGPFLFAYSLGFLYIGFLSLAHQKR